MARRTNRRTQKGQAWYRKADQCWYCTQDKKRTKLRDLQGQPIRGADNKREADKALSRLRLGMTPKPKTSDHVTVAEVCEAYLAKTEAQDSASHHRQAKGYLTDLNGHYGALPVADLKRHHVESWVLTHKGWKSPATTKNVLSIVKAAFAYGVDRELIPHNPIAGLKKPKAPGRETYFTDDEVKAVVDLLQAPAGFKAVSLAPVADFFLFLLHTGCRPSEAANLTAANLEETPDGPQFVLHPDEHKAGKKTAKPKYIMLNQDAEAIVRRLAMKNPDGPLFRTPRGRQWTRVNWVNTFISIRQKLGWDKSQDRRQQHLSFYSAKHTLAKRLLEGYYGYRATLHEIAGVLGITEKVAEGHYAKWCADRKAPLWAAIGRSQQRQAG